MLCLLHAVADGLNVKRLQADQINDLRHTDAFATCLKLLIKSSQEREAIRDAVFQSWLLSCRANMK